MRLARYSSIRGAVVPNLVAVQDEELTALPRVLVCPMKSALRIEVQWEGHSLVACPELTRPIRRSGLYRKGWLDDESSRQILDRLQLLLAR